MSELQGHQPTAIDPQVLAEARQLIGVPLRRDRMQFVESATADAIRHFAAGIHDSNPLWQAPEYASQTRWGSVLAPPTFLYAVDSTIVAPKMPGWQWIYAGTTFRWFDVLREGQKFGPRAWLTAVEEKQGRRFTAWALQSGRVDYELEDGRIVATAVGRTARTPRNSAREERGGKGTSSQADVVSPAIAAPEAAGYGTPHPPRTGNGVLLWEDVELGTEVPSQSDGPLSVSDIVGWYRGAQGALHYGGAHGDAVRYRRRHADYEINAETGAKDATARGHFQAREGRAVGMEGVYDVGPQRISWAARMLTDWIGDNGFLAYLSVDVLRPNLVGETTSWSGAVTGKGRQGGNHFVTVELKAQNQAERQTARGCAIVALPTRTSSVVLPLDPDIDLDPRRLGDNSEALEYT